MLDLEYASIFRQRLTVIHVSLSPCLILNPRLKLAETAAKIINEGFLLPGSKNPQGGRPSLADSEEKVATRINVPRQTLNLDKRYLASFEFNHAAA